MPDAVSPITVTVNGERYGRTVLHRQLLVHFIRDTLGLRATHIGCDSGNCGACTVICDGKIIKSCMQLAVQADGREITTAEGLAGPTDPPTNLQAAFNRHHSVQCGYCTPGFLLSATALLADQSCLTRDEIRHALKGNICRCTGYVNIIRAVESVVAEEATK